MQEYKIKKNELLTLSTFITKFKKFKFEFKENVTFAKESLSLRQFEALQVGSVEESVFYRKFKNVTKTIVNEEGKKSLIFFEN